MKLVRRARKSIRERRMKACVNDLKSNLARVEMKVFRQQKQAHTKAKRLLGMADTIPADVLQGKMNPELYAIECQLYADASLPRPAPYVGYNSDVRHEREESHRIGFVDFKTLFRAVRQINGKPAA